MLVNQVRRFGEALVERHVLSRDSLEHAIEESERAGQPLPAVLLKLGLVGSKDLTAALADQLGVPFVDFLETPIHQDAPTLLTAELARKYLALPVDFEDHKLLVAFAEPFIAANVPDGVRWHVTDSDDRVLAGPAASSPAAATRVVGGADASWLMRVWRDSELDPIPWTG